MLATVQDSALDPLDLGRTNVAPGSERHCALTRELKPVAEMVRFVISPDGSVVPDVKRKLPGRGIWVTGTRAALQEAVKRNVFPRGFKREVRVASDLAELTERLIERAALDALAIAAKAGLVAAGSAKVESAIERGDVLALIHASDAAADGVRKLNAALQRKTAEKSREIAIVDLFSRGQLDLALNRPNVVHAALLSGPGGETFLVRAGRLRRFQTGPSPAHARTDGARGQISE